MVHRFPRLAALLLLLLGLAWGPGARAQPGQVRLSLLEADGPSGLHCTLEILVRDKAGDAVQTCERRQPVSRLAARRVLTASEAARLRELAAARPPAPASPAPRPDEAVRVSLTIEADNVRIALDLSRGTGALSAGDQQLVRMLREIGDELRAAGRR
jgi:hypothetical protein